MALKKGDKLNPFGRPIGSKNKSTAEIRILIQQFVENNISSIQETFNELEAEKKLQFFDKMLNHILPKMQSVDAKIDLNNLTETQLEFLINSLNINENE